MSAKVYNETDAGDFAIGDAHAPVAVTKKAAASGPQGPVFGIPAKLEVSTSDCLGGSDGCRKAGRES